MVGSILLKNIPQTFQLAVVGQEGYLYQGVAQSISTANKVGPLSVLPGHTNFISIITDTLKVTDVSGEVFEFELNLGVMRVFANEVDVYVGIEAVTPELMSSLQGPK